jgi:hypothetical protein
MWWDDLGAFDDCKMGAHGHRCKKDVLLDFSMYHSKIRVIEGVVEIV